jgi:serine/threonine protein kinase
LSNQSRLANDRTEFYISPTASSAFLSPSLAVQSPYTVKFYDGYIDADMGVCLIMEYMEGGSIRSLVQHGLVLDEYNIAVIAFSVLSALKDVHGKKVVHRDIKVFSLEIVSKHFSRIYSAGKHPMYSKWQNKTGRFWNCESVVWR